MYNEFLHLRKIKDNIYDDLYDMIENNFIVKYFNGNCDKYNKFNSIVYMSKNIEKDWIEWIYTVIMYIDEE